MTDSKDKTILIIDDENLILNMLEDVLHLHKFKVLKADNGSLALTLAEKHKPDLAIVDISMPKMNGYEVIEKLRNISDIPVIVLTGQIEYEDIMAHKKAVPDTYMQKPVKSADLINTIHYLLASTVQDNSV